MAKERSHMNGCDGSHFFILDYYMIVRFHHGAIICNISQIVQTKIKIGIIGSDKSNGS